MQSQGIMPIDHEMGFLGEGFYGEVSPSGWYSSVFHLLLTCGFPKWKIDGVAAADSPQAVAAVAMADEVPHSFLAKMPDDVAVTMDWGLSERRWLKERRLSTAFAWLTLNGTAKLTFSEFSRHWMLFQWCLILKQWGSLWAIVCCFYVFLEKRHQESTILLLFNVCCVKNKINFKKFPVHHLYSMKIILFKDIFVGKSMDIFSNIYSK